MNSRGQALCGDAHGQIRNEHVDPERFVRRLTAARIGTTFNFYRDGAGAQTRRRRLRAYLEDHAGFPPQCRQRRFHQRTAGQHDAVDIDFPAVERLDGRLDAVS